MQRAGARLERARVAVEEARLELHRTEKLAREGFLSASRLDTARLGVTAGRREVDAARAAHAAAVAIDLALDMAGRFGSEMGKGFVSDFLAVAADEAQAVEWLARDRPPRS